MRQTVLILGLGALLCAMTPALARSHRGAHAGSQPIIAGQPNIRVTPSGNVVSNHHRVGKRLRNGIVPLRRSRYRTPRE